MRTEEEIKRTLEAWKKDPQMNSIYLKKNKELAAGKEMINMLEWILGIRGD